MSPSQAASFRGSVCSVPLFLCNKVFYINLNIVHKYFRNMEFADQMIIRHRLMDAIRLLEVHRVEYMPDESVEFDFKGYKVNLKFTVKEHETEVRKVQKITS